MLFGSSCFATPFRSNNEIAPIIVRYFSKSLSNILGKYLTTIVITPYFYNFSIYYFTIFPTQNLLLILSRELKSNIFRKVGMFLVNSNSCWLKWVKKDLKKYLALKLPCKWQSTPFQTFL